MIKILSLLLTVALFFITSTNFVFAAPGDLLVTPEKTPLFSESGDGLWLPGYSLTRTVYVKNNASEIKLVSLTPSTFLDNPRDLSKQMEIKVADNFGNTLYGGSPKKFLNDFYALVEYPLSYLLPSHDVTYSLTVTLDGDSTGNEWRNKTTGFDLAVGFYSETAPTPTPTTSSDNNSNGSTTTSNTSTTSTSDPSTASNPTPTPTMPQAGIFIPVTYGTEGNIINVPVLGAETSATPTPKKTLKETIIGAAKKKGQILGTCANPWWWWLLYIVQVIFQIIMHRISRVQNRKLVLIAQVLSGVLFGFIFWKFFCSLWFLIVSLIISALFLYSTHKKT